MNRNINNTLVYSFDVFDTCLCRICGSSINVFEVMSKVIAKKLKTINNQQNVKHLCQLFVSLREEENYKGGGLDDIYNRLLERLKIPFTKEELIDTELSVENNMLVPIRETANLIESLRCKGRIVFISDIYLPSLFLKNTLKKFGLFKEGDAIYASEECKAWKSDGSLFDLVSEKEGIAFRNWHHYGDHYYSDYLIPRKKGIKPHLLSYGYIGYESQWLQGSLSWPYKSIVAGISRAMRLSFCNDKEQCKFVADLSAPLLVPWVLKVLSDASNKGISNIFFCARDAHSAFHVAKTASALFPKIKIHYLFVSRQSIYNQTKNFLDYLESVGMLSENNVAVVDLVSTGKSSIVFNDIIRHNGGKPVTFYYLYRCNISSEIHINNASSLNDIVEIESLYALCKVPNWARYSGVRIFFEILFTLNYHKKTIGYQKRGCQVLPILGEDDTDSWSMPSVREKKSYNDKLLTFFTEALIKTESVDYYNEILQNLSLPTWESFIEFPKREYLDYLHELKINGKHFVDVNLPFRKTKSEWIRGGHVFSLPRRFADKWFNYYIWLKRNVSRRRSF
jgi:predicted HAD superfamily hydrolase